jgi:hypothetical protein
VDLLQLTPISGVGLRSGGDQPINDSYIEVMMQYSDTEGSWMSKKDYRGEIMVGTHIFNPQFKLRLGLLTVSEGKFWDHSNWPKAFVIPGHNLSCYIFH